MFVSIMHVETSCQQIMICHVPDSYRNDDGSERDPTREQGQEARCNA